MLNVLSLFDGMSCGQIALSKSNIKVGTYYASEIDKPAMSISKKNYPNTVYLGDVTRWREWDIDWASIGLLMGGSPCQGFSFAGKQLAFDDPRSVLFFVFVDILNHIKSVNPDVKFLLENVRMKREFLDVITEHLGVEPVFINSALVSAQNRHRYYWANWSFGQPEDRGIMIKDILEDEIDSSFKYSPKSIAYMERGNEKWQQAGSRRADRYTQTPDTEKAFTLTANFHKGVPYNYFCDTRKRQVLRVKEATKKGYIDVEDGECFDLTFPTSKTRRGRSMKHKSNCLTAANYDFMRFEVHNRIAGVSVDERGVRPYRGDKRKSGLSELGRLTFAHADPTDAVTTGHAPKILKPIMMPGMESETITPESLVREYVYRKLTPVECERLQTVPDNYTAGVSNTQRYKMLGNGWSVDTIVHIFVTLPVPRMMPGITS
jgi:DNA (cytosine-5)-methyltransferase 3A